MNERVTRDGPPLMRPGAALRTDGLLQPTVGEALLQVHLPQKKKRRLPPEDGWEKAVGTIAHRRPDEVGWVMAPP